MWAFVGGKTDRNVWGRPRSGVLPGHHSTNGLEGRAGGRVLWHSEPIGGGNCYEGATPSYVLGRVGEAAEKATIRADNVAIWMCGSQTHKLTNEPKRFIYDSAIRAASVAIWICGSQTHKLGKEPIRFGDSGG